LNQLAQTDEQNLLVDTLRRFLQQHNAFEERRKRLTATPPQRLALWPQLAELGLIGAALPESQGGFAGDARTCAAVMAELGTSLAVEPYLSSAIVAGRVLQHCTDSAVRDAAIEQMIAGTQIPILAHDSGRDPYAPPRLQARGDGDTIVIDGVIRQVRHADVANMFIVSAVVDGEIQLLWLPADSDGLQPKNYRLMDGAGGGDLHLSQLKLPRSAQLQLDRPAAEVLAEAFDWALLGMAAEALGMTSAVNTATFAYLTTRKQFGVPLASFQALQHRAADMYIAAEELKAIVDASIAAFDGGNPMARSRAAAAMKSVADSAGRRIAHDAVQLHGGMGVSDELDISHYARRLATMRAEIGSADLYRQRFGSSTLEETSGAEESGAAQQWRAQVSEFIAQHLPKDLSHKVELGLKLEKADYVRWQKILYEQGWFAGAWPREFGGQGWDLPRQLVFAQESGRCNAPLIIPYGVNMVGPVIYSFGNEQQKRDHLPAILSSDVWWCQGYSEPGSGSDLASLKTTAVLDGDEYVVNGTKMWTTEAHWADKMHCLVRTDSSTKPQAGISFLLIDMNTPGITVQPIVTIDGIHHTNQVFLDNVRVPVGNRVGHEGQGWAIAKFLLANERSSIADTGPKLRLMRHLKQMYAAVMSDAEVPANAKPMLSGRLADIEIQLMTLCALERRYVDAWANGTPMGAEASLLKIRGTEILQAQAELALELEGPLAAAHDPADLHLEADQVVTATQKASLLGHEYLYSRCWSIFGGTNEVQRNIIARQLFS
jgi:alkylation response protein AidB-like acyl-CoA dehydrogenase